MFTWFENLGGPAFLVLIGVILSAIGAFWASHQQARKSDEIAKLNEKIAAQQGEVSTELGKQLKLQEELRLKSDEIAHLNLELRNSVIGGDSFCYLAVSSLNSKTNTGLLIAIHEGKYHLYDVDARIVDLERFEEVKSRLSFETMRYTDTRIRIGNLTPGYAATLRTFHLGNADTRRFNIFFTARNGGFTQLLRFKKVDGEWVNATKVVRDKGRDQEVLFEKVDPKYPRNSKGQVEW